LRAPEEGDVLCRTLVSMVSTGTEMRVWSGVEKWVSFPYVPGYSSVAEVVESKSSSLANGTLVYVRGGALKDMKMIWGGHSAWTIGPASELPVLGTNVPAEEWTFLAPLAIALHGVRRSRAEAGDKVVVFGVGLIGMLAARILLARGCEVACVDMSPFRLEKARAGGVNITIKPGAGGAAEELKKYWPKGADIAIEATANTAAIEPAIACLRERSAGNEPSPRLLLLSSYTQPIVFQYRPAYIRELEVKLSYSNTVSDLFAARDMLGHGHVRVGDLITLRGTASEAPDMYRQLKERGGEHFTAVIQWDDK